MSANLSVPTGDTVPKSSRKSNRPPKRRKPVAPEIDDSSSDLDNEQETKLVQSKDIKGVSIGAIHLLQQALLTWVKRVIPEATKSAIGCIPGVAMTSGASRAEPGVYVRNSAGDERTIHQPDPFRRVATQRCELAAARERYEYRRICRLRLGLIRRSGKSFSRRRS